MRPFSKQELELIQQNHKCNGELLNENQKIWQRQIPPPLPQPPPIVAASPTQEPREWVMAMPIFVVLAIFALVVMVELDINLDYVFGGVVIGVVIGYLRRIAEALEKK